MTGKRIFIKGLRSLLSAHREFIGIAEKMGKLVRSLLRVS